MLGPVIWCLGITWAHRSSCSSRRQLCLLCSQGSLWPGHLGSWPHPRGTASHILLDLTVHSSPYSSPWLIPQSNSSKT